MQPVYVTLNSSGSSPWKTVNWHCVPQQISFAVTSTGGSSWSVDVTYQDPSGTFGSTALSTSPIAFSYITGSANAVVAIGSNSSVGPIAGYRLNLNTQSSVGAPVTLTAIQAGIG